jgi:hypothetical protein
LAIYAGYVVRYPVGGHVLAELHNIVGLLRLGYRVVFVEESGSNWNACYDAARDVMSDDPAYGIGVLRETLRPFGLERSWCYVDRQRRYHGLPAEELRAACREATLLFSRARVTWLPELADCRRKIFVDVDPVFTQIDVADHPARSASGCASPADFDFHFTYGEHVHRLGDCLPLASRQWRPTRPPVALELVAPRFTPEARQFTTVLSWTAYGSVTRGGATYGQKDVEMAKLLDLPRRVGSIFHIALGGAAAPAQRLREMGWNVSEARDATLSVAAYLDFIGRSRGEFSVAKHAYVSTRCGWFSDRTANYLAMGKPAVVQDTGFSDFLPCGEGLFAFRNADEAVAAIEAIAADYPRHCRAARRIAEEYLAAGPVLGRLLRECGLPVTASSMDRA